MRPAPVDLVGRSGRDGGTGVGLTACPSSLLRAHKPWKSQWFCVRMSLAGLDASFLGTPSYVVVKASPTVGTQHSSPTVCYHAPSTALKELPPSFYAGLSLYISSHTLWPSFPLLFIRLFSPEIYSPVAFLCKGMLATLIYANKKGGRPWHTPQAAGLFYWLRPLQTAPYESWDGESRIKNQQLQTLDQRAEPYRDKNPRIKWGNQRQSSPA